MLSYKCLFCLLAISIVDSIEILSNYPDLKNLEQYYHYQTINGDKVKLQVYYECLCPDCIAFHLGPLDDVYRKIGSYIDLKLYPYGNAKKSEKNGKTVITCQHGPAECYGNKLHACAIEILNDISKAEFYNSCMMNGTWGGRGSTDMDATNCGKSMGIDSKAIIACAKSSRGEDLLEYYGQETDKLVDKQYVPWVLINGEFFDSNGDLMKKICETLSNSPPPCAELSE
ncbi:gamma-interferon-inducible lysosomal thiol reductase-like [Leguminivora glycinivorella]|uniref:gamma-interferon-inducible lysosomal thiol reductase-like n=1 Tax=Leguminivora glycinivorella TaxID=1035111 RepID=UPI00200E6258|nr:gamma-interferon-inducible lysosomal thiol reductase-like [Leguminivora glycinivorella]